MRDEKGKRVFHTRKLKNLMLDARVRTYKKLAELSGYSEATIRKARRERIGVPYDTACFIVQKLLTKMEELTGEKPYGGKSVKGVLDEVTISVFPASRC